MLRVEIRVGVRVSIKARVQIRFGVRFTMVSHGSGNTKEALQGTCMKGKTMIKWG